MPRSRYGSSVIDGEVQYFSASSLTLGDPDSAEGCLRKWWYEKVMGKKTPSTGAQELGTKLHAEIEEYLRTGVNNMGPLAMRGKPMIPTPGPDLFIEHDIMLSPAEEMVARDAVLLGRHQEASDIREGASLLSAPLRLRGKPVVGYIDLMHRRCTNKGVSDIEDIYDPPGTVEIVDWKTTSRPQYIKTSVEVSRTIQMTVYGKWVTTTLPDALHVRLSHGYFVTKGPTAPQKSTIRLTPWQIDRQWERIERVAGSIIDAGRETDVDKVPANLRACGAFGGCPHRSYCRAGTQQSLVSFFGTNGAANMIRRLNNVSIFGAKKDPALQEETRRVAREEIEAKYPGLPAAWDELVGRNVGSPQYEGELARVVGDLSGAAVNTTSIPGVGGLANAGPFSDPGDIAKLLTEVKDFNIVSLSPPDAPASDPELASEPQKRGRGRPKSKTSGVQDATASAIVEMTQLPLPNVEPSSGKIYFYVNCVPSLPYETFWPTVHELVADLNKASGEALDFRLVPNDHKFAYGRWKAAIAAALTTCTLPPGHYVLNGAGGEIATAVVEAMRTVVAARGGVFIQ